MAEGKIQISIVFTADPAELSFSPSDTAADVVQAMIEESGDDIQKLVRDWDLVAYADEVHVQVQGQGMSSEASWETS